MFDGFLAACTPPPLSLQEKHLDIYGGLNDAVIMKKLSARPNGPREKAETAISCGGPGPARKKKAIYDQ